MKFSLYMTPRHTFKKGQYDAFTISLGRWFLVGGDLNSKHQYSGSRLINSKLKKFTKPYKQIN
jgi:hypothetical protein